MQVLLTCYYFIFALLLLSYLLTHVFIATNNVYLYFTFLGISITMIIVLFSLKFFIK